MLGMFEAIRRHKDNLNLGMGIYITLCHLGGLVGLCYLPFAKWETLLWAFILWPISGLGITAGAHRLWSHRAYTATLPLRVFLMLINSVANQGSIFHWARDHRVHHKHSETPADPHNAKWGFFFAHMGWLYVKKDARVKEAGKRMGNFNDLRNDGPVMFQKMLDPWGSFFMCFAMPALVAQRYWGEDFYTAMWTAGFLRYVVVLHFTWLVNSAAHLWGERPYDVKSNPAENAFVAIASIGEGWHNWHHAFPFDYAASELGVSRQFNPTKLFIDLCCLLGLASNRKRALKMWRVRREKMLNEGYSDTVEGPPMFKSRVMRKTVS